MADAKTQPTAESLESFLARIPDANRRTDCAVVANIMSDVTGEPAVVWATGIVGFGTYTYDYGKGKQAAWPLVGFASRASDITLYLMLPIEEYPSIGSRLGKFKSRRSCIYIRKLSDVDLEVLRQMVQMGMDRSIAIKQSGTGHIVAVHARNAGTDAAVPVERSAIKSSATTSAGKPATASTRSKKQPAKSASKSSATRKSALASRPGSTRATTRISASPSPRPSNAGATRKTGTKTAGAKANAKKSARKSGRR